MATFEAHPTATEVVVASLPAGSVLRVHHPDVGVREYRAAYSRDKLVIVVVGDMNVLPWGCRDNRYGSLHPVQLRRDKLDRPVWQEAVRLLKDGGVLYLDHQQRPYYNTERWTATATRVIEGSGPALARAQAGAPEPAITWIGERAAVVEHVRLSYWDRCGTCKQGITGITDGARIRVELYESDDRATVEWRRTQEPGPLPAEPTVCPHCGGNPLPMMRGGYIEGAGQPLDMRPIEHVLTIKEELRRRFPALAALADDEYSMLEYLY